MSGRFEVSKHGVRTAIGSWPRDGDHIAGSTAALSSPVKGFVRLWMCQTCAGIADGPLRAGWKHVWMVNGM